MKQKIQRVIAGTLLGILLVGAHWGGVTRDVFAENTSSGEGQTSTGGADKIKTEKNPEKENQKKTDTNPGVSVAFTNPLKFKTFRSLADLVLSEAWKIALPFAVLFYLYAGYLYLTAFGNPGKVSQANSILIYTSVGYGVIVLAHVIPVLIEGVINGIGSIL